eukprot:3908384-Amphidinium_carterae.1
MVEAYQKGPRAFPTKPIQGPSIAPTTVSLTTPYSWSEWNPEQYGSLPSDLVVQQGEMMQMMWNHTRNQAARVDNIKKLLRNQYQILRAGCPDSLIPMLLDSFLTTTETFAMMSEDRNAHIGIPHAYRDNPGNFVELKTKTEAMAKISYQIFNKQKEYQRECQILLDKCNKLEENLAQAKRDAKIWAEQSRTNEMKRSALEESTRHLRTSTADTEDRVNDRLQRVDEHIVLVDDILGTHTGLIRRSTEEAFQREEAHSQSSIGRDNELSNRLAACEYRNYHLSSLVHELYMVQAREKGIPEAQRPVLRRIAPEPEEQHGVIVHAYTGTPAFRMYEPPAPIIHSIYRDPLRDPLREYNT